MASNGSIPAAPIEVDTDSPGTKRHCPSPNYAMQEGTPFTLEMFLSVIQPLIVKVAQWRTDCAGGDSFHREDERASQLAYGRHKHTDPALNRLSQPLKQRQDQPGNLPGDSPEVAKVRDTAPSFQATPTTTVKD